MLACSIPLKMVLKTYRNCVPKISRIDLSSHQPQLKNQGVKSKYPDHVGSDRFHHMTNRNEAYSKTAEAAQRQYDSQAGLSAGKEICKICILKAPPPLYVIMGTYSVGLC